MVSWQSFSPFRHFPSYTGPHAVGICDVEIPVSELDSPAPPPDNTITTVSFRVFYPCETPTKSQRPARWVPEPQSIYVAAYARFVGASPTLSSVLSLFPQLLYLTNIPALTNVRLLRPTTESGRWPVVAFSHGLGGGCHGMPYSHICGSLASYGLVVFAVDHRDESAPIAFIHEANGLPARTLGYQKLPHQPSPKVYQARDKQLRIRLWELGLLHNAMEKIDRGSSLTNVAPNTDRKGQQIDVLNMFRNVLDIHEPGSIVWAGHSFGAASVVQLLKSTFYGGPSEDKGEFDEALFEPTRDSSLVRQITPSSLSILLDMWSLPLRSRSTRWLWNKPMPCYDTSTAPAGGQTILSVSSEAFFKWSGNMNDTKRTLVPTQAAPNETLQWSPHLFYPSDSAHLSQSDFGVVFPWLIGHFLKVKEPERLLQLNVRAILQVLRINNVEVAPPSPVDLEDADLEVSSIGEKSTPTNDLILNTEGKIRGWHHITVDDFEGLHIEQDYKSSTPELDEAEALELRGTGEKNMI